MSNKERAGGPIVQEWSNHFLRDDSKMRDYLPEDEREAYSLFRIEPYGREIVYCGSLQFALESAQKYIDEN